MCTCLWFAEVSGRSDGLLMRTKCSFVGIVVLVADGMS